jgi:hypothetical protein
VGGVERDFECKVVRLNFSRVKGKLKYREHGIF